ncbi:MAG: histidine--tRNA ligase [Candidatus Micrarchaeota archaeon]|nr:histidine--tRNA ligase [Candidatus Micrarchaeota archaeon]
MKLAPKGMRDILPEDAILREQVVELVKNIYRKYGYVPMESPALEYLTTLRAKGGEEIGKQIFVLDDDELGLRFDLTVPLARIAANNSFAKPFKRYAIASVWRKEEPQKGRFREFWQADVDVIGTKGMRADIEILTIAREVVVSLGFDKPRIMVNNRKILDAFAAKLQVEDKKEAIFRLLDKIDKVGEQVVKDEMEEVIGEDKTKQLFQLFDTKGDNKKKLKVASEISEEGASELQQIVDGCDFDVEINLFLVRGLGYYTGPIFEIKASDDIGSVYGGGRYDNLLGAYGQPDSAVGISLGIERIVTLLKEKKTQNNEVLKTFTKVYVAAVKDEFYKDAVKVATELRQEDISCETDLNERNLRKQFDYVNSMAIPYMLILGEKELKEKKFTLRDMKTGKEEKLELKKLIEKLKSI